MYRWIAWHLLAPVLDFSRGSRTLKCRQVLEQSQWWPRDRIIGLQNKRLRQLIKYAYKNVPYYRRIFDERGFKPGDIKGAQDLVKLPILTKRLIRENFDGMIARGFPSKELLPNSTGGSTGEALKFYSTKDDQYNWGHAASLRAHRWVGYEVGDKVIAFYETGHRMYSRMDKLRGMLGRFFERVLVISTKEMSPDRLLSRAKKLEDFKPEVIRGYPSAIYLLARLIEREGKPRLRPRAVIVDSEQLYDYQRELFGKVFGCETFSHYDSFEVHPIANECPEHAGCHIAAENVIVEVVDGKGKPVPTGREGRILVTNLHNYAMPFIRYDMGDIGALSDKACPCGRGLPLLAKVTGRTTDYMRTKSGGFIPGMAVPWSFFATLGVEQFQIVQETRGEMIVKLVLDRKYPEKRKDEIAKKIVDFLRKVVGEGLEISVKFVDQIPTTKAGKRRVIISKLPPGEVNDF
jgi:phenylacetate-CoA ligase